MNFVCIEVGQDDSRDYINLDQIERVGYYDAISFTSEGIDEHGERNGELYKEVRKGISVRFTSGEVQEYTRDRAVKIMEHIDPDLVEYLQQNLITQRIA